MRRRQRRVDRRTRRFVAAMCSVNDRPSRVEDRRQPGHWEADLLIRAGGQSAIGTLVERSRRFTKLVHLDGDRTTGTVTPALIKALRTVVSHLRSSLTRDQGMEMTEHHLISGALEIEVYFCDPASPWQRGTNENTNGLLRQYFPKGTDLSHVTPTDLNGSSERATPAPANPWAAEALTRSSANSRPYLTHIAATITRSRP
jgi:IS30 family transposase